MASTLPTPLECCQTCTDPQDVNVPGRPGDDGDDGDPGTDGLNAFTTLVGGEAIPIRGNSSVNTIELVSPPGSQWIGLGQILYIQSLGYFRVTGLPSQTSVEVENLDYPGNDPGGAADFFPAGLTIQPGGLMGPDGLVPAGALLTANLLSEISAAPDALIARGNLGLGTAAQGTLGVANGNVVIVNDGGGLTVGEAVFATATGVESKAAGAAQTALGLGSMAVQSSGAVAISGGTVTGITDLAVADGGTGASSAAAARVNLGVGIQAIATKIANYAAFITDNVLLADATAGAITIVLPLAAVSTGLTITVKKLDVSGNTVTVQGNTGELIDGTNTQVISAQWDSLAMISNGTSWFII